MIPQHQPFESYEDIALRQRRQTLHVLESIRNVLVGILILLCIPVVFVVLSLLVGS